MNATPNDHMPSKTANRKSRAWLWFFGLLILLTATVITIEIWYNLRQQLKPEQLAGARQLWREKGPVSYEVRYTLKRQDGGEEKRLVTVREGTLATNHGRRDSFASMDSLFDYVEKRLEADAQPGTPRVFVTAIFDRHDGHILRYVRSVRSNRERLEVVVQLRPLP